MSEGFSLRCKVIGERPLNVYVGAIVSLAKEIESGSPELVFRLRDASMAGDGWPA
ncbi:hypothetical protein AB4212_35875 [Streptomyces sp. 2MCAF27]